MAGVEVAHVNVLDRAMDPGQPISSKPGGAKQPLGVLAIDGRHAASEHEERRLGRFVEREPVPVEMVAQGTHAGRIVAAALSCPVRFADAPVG
jgi:hypothetical protein